MPDGPLRIALFTHSVNPRGGVVHTLELAEALQAQGQSVTVFATARAGQQWFRPIRCDSRLVTVTDDPGPADLAGSVRARMRAVVMAPIDGFDIHHAQDSISACALAMRQRSGRLSSTGGAPSGFLRTVHHLDHFDDPCLARWQRRGYQYAAAVFCVSRTWCEILARDHGVLAHQVDNGVNLGRYRPLPDAQHHAADFRQVARFDAEVARSLGVRDDAPLLVAVGGIEARKNPLRTLQAFLRLRESLPDAQLVIAGGASLLPHDDCQRRFDALLAQARIVPGPGQPVVISGPLADFQMPSLLRRADVVMMASLAEGFGLVVLEALASATPVVVSLRAPFTEYLTDADLRDAVYWSDPEDVGSMAAAMRAALAAPAFDPPAVCLRFSWQRCARQHLAVYRSYRHSTEPQARRQAMTHSTSQEQPCLP